MTLVIPALDERIRTIEEGTGKEIGGRMNTNASMYVRSYKARQGKEWKNEGGTESGRNRQESSREEAELVRHMMRRVMEMEVQLREAEERRA